MRARKSEYLDEFVVNQYPIEILKKIIFATLDIVDNFIITLGEESYLDSSSISNYEERLGSFNSNPSSKIESIYINQLSTDSKMKEFILKYGNALNSLNSGEREVFVAAFIKGEDNISIQDELKICPIQLNIIKKSAIVRFSLKLGLDKFINLFS